MEFLRVKCKGCLNSFRQPDFHTYHKTLPLPPKTTVAGMLGSALGISPREVNDDWLKNDRFRIGIVGKNNGKANDLWQIRKYETKQIAAHNKGIEAAPYKTAVIVRELLYGSTFMIYFNFTRYEDRRLIFEKLNNPAWALSLGREDELIKILEIKTLDLKEKENYNYRNTVLPFDINQDRYKLSLENISTPNLLNEAPKIVKLPVSFTHKEKSEAREADLFQMFTFISNLPIMPTSSRGFYDPEEDCVFQTF